VITLPVTLFRLKRPSDYEGFFIYTRKSITFLDKSIKQAITLSFKNILYLKARYIPALAYTSIAT
ncbi:hypothetical protein, partial [Acinetobacter baumannii]|uniref:hypothetical protein n=1 Tax=Acinetobacter baumannii TaxID=470 RepID=UPI001BC890C0